MFDLFRKAIKRLLPDRNYPEKVEDVLTHRIVNVTKSIMLGYLITGIFGVIYGIVFSSNLEQWITALVSLAVFIICNLLLEKNRPLVAVNLALGIAYALLVLNAVRDGVFNNGLYGYFLLLIITTTILPLPRHSFIWAIVSSIGLSALGWAEYTHLIPLVKQPPGAYGYFYLWLEIIILIYIGFSEGLERIRMTNWLTGQMRQLEKEVQNREKAQAELQIQRDFALQVLENSGQGIFVSDRDSQLEYVNPFFAHLLGLEIHEILGRSKYDFYAMHGNDKSRLQENEMRTGAPSTYETELVHKDGHIIPVMVTRVPRKPFPPFTGAIGVVTDLTERRRTEELLLQGQKRESLGYLAGGVAHDFNNLLTAIIGQVSLAQARSDPQAAHQSYLNKALSAADSASHLAEQLLAYAGKGKRVVQRVDISMLVQETINVLRETIHAGVKLSLEIEPNLPAVDGDRFQLQQVVLNLIFNANEAISKESGKIAIKLTKHHLHRITEQMAGGQALPIGEYVLLEVTDNGSGMDEFTMRRIFDPFFTTKPRGHGLGLSAISGIIHAHHGGINVESHVGLGSKFSVLLPAAPGLLPKDDTQPQTGQMSIIREYKKTILVVDDQELILETLADILEQNGYNVITANSGLIAIDLYKQQVGNISLVILDLQMPDMDGKQTLAKMVEITPRMNVICSSGYSENLWRPNSFPLANLRFLSKPYNIQTLMKCVSDILNQLSK